MAYCRECGKEISGWATACPHCGAPIKARPQTGDEEYSVDTFGILAIVLGAVGAHYFYIGKTGAGMLQILFNIITLGMANIVSVISGVVALSGTLEEFENRFVYTEKTYPPLF